MKCNLDMHLVLFPVLARDNRTGEEEALTIPVTKDQLRASGVVGQSSKELLTRMLERQGYTPLEIGIPDKRTITLDLMQLCRLTERGGIVITEGMKSFLSKYGVDDRRDREYYIELWDTGYLAISDCDDGGGSIVIDMSKPGGDPLANG